MGVPIFFQFHTSLRKNLRVGSASHYQDRKFVQAGLTRRVGTHHTLVVLTGRASATGDQHEKKLEKK
jgi:hypothetical protein